MNENFQIRGFSVASDDIALNGMYGMAPISRIPTDILDSITVLKGPNALVGGIAPTGSVGGVIIANTKRADKNLTQLNTSIEKSGYTKTGIDISRRFGAENQFGIRVNSTYGEGEHTIKSMKDQLKLGSIATDYTTDKIKINLDAYSIREHRKNGSPAMVSMEKLTEVIDAPSGDKNYFPHLDGKTSSDFIGLSTIYKITPITKIFGGIGYAEKEYEGHIFGTRMILKNTLGDATSQYYRTALNEHNTTFNAGITTESNLSKSHHVIEFRVDYLNRNYWQHAKATSSAFTTNLYNPTTIGTMPTTYPTLVPYGNHSFTSYTFTDQISFLQDQINFILGARYQEMNIKNTYSDTQYKANKLSPTLGITFKANDLTSIYASYVEGLSQGVTVDNILDVNYGKTFKPFQTKQYELGLKYKTVDWFNTFAVFQIEKPSTMTTAYTDSQYTQLTTDGANTRSRGLEWQFNGKLSEKINLSGNAAYTHTKIIKASENQGNNVYGVPKLTSSLNLEYSLFDMAVINFGTQYVGKQYLNNQNSLSLKSYFIMNSGINYKVTMFKVPTTINLNIDNITNKKYWAGVFNSNYAIIGADRNYKLGLTFNF